MARCDTTHSDGDNGEEHGGAEEKDAKEVGRPRPWDGGDAGGAGRNSVGGVTRQRLAASIDVASAHTHARSIK